MSIDHHPSFCRHADFFQHVRVCIQNSWIIHHFRQANDGRMGQIRAEIIRSQRRAVLLEGRCRHTRRQLHQNIHVGIGGVLEHKVDSDCPCDVRNFMRIGHNGRNTVFDERP